MSTLLKRARETLTIEIAGLEELSKRLNHEFEQAVNLLYDCQGKVILAGMGKSGLIAQKNCSNTHQYRYSRTFFACRRKFTW